MTAMPRLGQGTWEMGDDPARRAEEIAALRLGLDLGLTLIDTAEMYGDGRSEELVGAAIAGRRDRVYLVTKVHPANASRRGTLRAAERSLKRLRSDRVDLYLLHWEGSHPIEDTVAAFDQLVREGKIVRWGVSNFDIAGLDAVAAAPGGRACAANQVYYNLLHRSAERRVLPWCAAHGVTVMSYTPLEQGRLDVRPALRRVAERHGVAPFAAALAWAARRPGLVALAKASKLAHLGENAAALRLRLTDEDLRDLDADYPPPDRDVPLETL